MHARIRSICFALGVLVAPSLLSAQELAPPTPAAVAPAAGGPTLEATAVAFRPAIERADSASMEMQRRQSAGKPVALMVVGGAAILVGAVIGDAPGTLFMIGGAIALLYGLYQYLQ